MTHTVNSNPVGEWIVCVATSHELHPLRTALALRVAARAPYPLYEGARGGQRVTVLQTGIGPARARRAMAWLMAKPGRYRGVLAVGLSGALRATLAPGTMVIGDRWLCLERAGGRQAMLRAVGPSGNRRLLDRAMRAAVDCGCAVEGGSLLTVDLVVGKAGDKQRLGAQTDASAVDMESGAVAEAALAAGVDVVAVRVVLDALGEPLQVSPDQYLQANGSLSVWKSGLAVARRPHRLPGLWALGRRGDEAMSRAARWLCCFLDSETAQSVDPTVRS
ncbi:MAG: hypothetical protein AB1515_04835 [Nitrospirota bacterium]